MHLFVCYDVPKYYINLLLAYGCGCLCAGVPSDSLRRVFYKVVEAPVTIPSQKPPVDKPNPKQGIGRHLIALALSILFVYVYRICLLRLLRFH
jgi:hypothetical protein